MIIRNLSVRYGRFTAVDDVTLEIPDGRIVGLVGESGSGKSSLARAVCGLVPHTGTVEGARRTQMVFQDPYASLNPRMTVARTIAEGAGPGEVERLLGLVRLPAELAGRYPRELSGGQRQRVAIARALGGDPGLLVADEITSALDVSVQAAVLNLIRGLRDELGLTMLFISHNLAVVRYVADVVAVMHRGRLVEAGPAEQVVGEPAHEYTRALLAAVPRLRG
ncbi:Oligopeptide transport ATP-binding protein OppF (TC 3.A.1.5.1) [[Actinomadura] parvosata subsp. kistnae]|uniref:ABC transporter ATP-binding protein n=1 Tax=[Actinomadura] parvosata subsp. kistnae TaxID=1909395 RepID=A0A1V0A1Z7_9ACTN|nr:ATP-binding cassette domain-containing protein [Nonomuraea sp. ATCC 55076]AQZ64235.1 ABC transporter ATP-binding protein [Nonomuraea sp. ATCC 55076]SPM00066.1 Oligopeptide transport ATP-binding protein OppF (TC 3.A.1.5.1) [Actinomadura parvosata subsp. kistnae]